MTSITYAFYCKKKYITYTFLEAKVEWFFHNDSNDFSLFQFKKLYQRWKTVKIEKNYAKMGLVGQIILYAVPGLTFFIFLPATIISVFEGWQYDVSVYYAFVTLTTIGFGDYVAGNFNESFGIAYV